MRDGLNVLVPPAAQFEGCVWLPPVNTTPVSLKDAERRKNHPVIVYVYVFFNITMKSAGFRHQLIQNTTTEVKEEEVF